MGELIVKDLHGKGTFSAYLASASGPGPSAGIVILQTIFGVTQEMRNVANSLADAGYVVAVPDLYWRVARGLELTPPADLSRALELQKSFDYEAALDDIDATLQTLASRRDCTGQVGTVGFCLGGTLAFLLAARGSGTCNVGYYPVDAEKMLDRGPLQAPLQLHLPTADQHLNADGRARIKSALGKSAEIHEYEGVGHAFTRPTSPNWNPAATQLAQERTAAFLLRYLGGPSTKSRTTGA